jgi:hypothetical protein
LDPVADFGHRALERSRVCSRDDRRDPVGSFRLHPILPPRCPWDHARPSFEPRGVRSSTHSDRSLHIRACIVGIVRMRSWTYGSRSMDDRRIIGDIPRSVPVLHRPIPRYNSRHVVGSSTMRRGIPRTRPRDRATHPSIHVQVCRWTIARSSGTFLDQSPYSIDRSLDITCGIP